MELHSTHVETMPVQGTVCTGSDIGKIVTELLDNFSAGLPEKDQSYWLLKEVKNVAPADVDKIRNFFVNRGFGLLPHGQTFVETHRVNHPEGKEPTSCPLAVHFDNHTGIAYCCNTLLIYRGQFTGGQFYFEAHGSEHVFDPSNDNEDRLKFIMFRGNVVHWVTDLESGTRELVAFQFESEDRCEKCASTTA